MTPYRLLLASQSPRRRQFLSDLGIRFRAVNPDAEELSQGLPPDGLARENARLKALAALPGRKARHLNELVLAVDTIVVLGSRVLGKPCSAREAEGMLAALSGRTHEVISGLHLQVAGREGRAVTRSASTQVTFRRLSRRQIHWYVATGEGKDKAGAYGIQCLGALLVERIDGCYFNVVGFPVGAFLDALDDLSIPLDGLLAPNSDGFRAWRAMQGR